MKNTIRRFFLFLILLLPNIYALFRVTDLTESPIKAIGYLLFVLLALLLPTLILKSKTYFFFEGVMSLLLAPIELASIYLNQAATSVSFLNFIFSTNKVELLGVVGSLWYVIIAVVILLVIYFFLASREDNTWLLPRFVRLVVLLSVNIVIAAVIAYFALYGGNSEMTSKQKLSNAVSLTAMKFRKIFPYNIYLNAYTLYAENKHIKQQMQQNADFTFSITPQEGDRELLLVLVIGETARADHFSLNGYGRETNPLLKLQKNVISYPNAYSQANATQMAVPHILSRITIENNDKLYTEKTLLDAFREADYDRIWLTNKTPSAFTTSITQDCEYTFCSSQGGLSTNNNLDMKLLPELQKALAATRNNRKFIVLHTMGSHWRYDIRYTKEFEVFTPVIDKSFSFVNISRQDVDKIVNAYDNSILYTDYFLDSLISALDATDKPALLLYLSDHGENLYDDERQLLLHGSYAGTVYEYNIPFIVWYSDEYQNQYPDKTEVLRQHRDLQFNSSVVFHTLLDAAEVRQAVNQTKSLTSPTFQQMDTMFAVTGNEQLITTPTFPIQK